MPQIEEGKIVVRFGTVMADPPWPYRTSQTGRFAVPKPKGIETLHRRVDQMGYGTMSVEDICRLDVESLVKDDSHLYLWTTNSFMCEAHEVAEAWGFSIKTILTWGKVGADGRVHANGVGFWFRGATEHCLFAVRGSQKLLVRNGVSNLFLSRRLPHSVKPQRFFDVARAVSPGPHLEMFARKRRNGWKCWGNEFRSDVVIGMKG